MVPIADLSQVFRFGPFETNLSPQVLAMFFNFRAIIFAASLALIVSPCDSGCLILGQDQGPIDLVPTSSVADIYRVTGHVEGRGSVLTEEEKSIPLRLDARFQYDERVIARKQAFKSVRQYNTARAEIRLGQGSLLNTLPEDRSLILVQSDKEDERIRFASIRGPLTQKQLELIATPANTLLLPELVARKQVRPGETWTPGEEILTKVLNIDLIGSSTIELKLEKISGTVARIFISGEVEGAIDDAGTQLDVTGTLDFDISRGIVENADLTIRQQRDIGRIAPGLDAGFRILVRVEADGQSEALSDAGLARIRESGTRITPNLVFTPLEDNIRFLHTPDWKVIGAQRDRAILRLLENGQMVGQCDVMPLPPSDDSRPQTLEQFQEVVKSKLAEYKPSITDSAQSSPESDGADWMQVTAAGSANGVALIWNYFTITHSDGRRVQLVFTTEPANNSRFSSRFESLIAGISFMEKSGVPASNVSKKQLSAGESDE
jgi:hypothetical protein